MANRNEQKLLASLLIFFLIGGLGFPCTSIIVTKGASADGSVIITYSCDGEFLPRLRLYPAADHKPGEMVEIMGFRGKRGEIPEIAHTYKVLDLMNEFQVAIGETTFDGREELVNPDGLLNYPQLMLLALQRAKTAREAIRVMADLVEQYGYASSGESFSIADKNEAWIMEMIGTGKGGHGAVWVALRIPDGMICAHANMSRIGEFPLNDPENCLYSKNVISLAVEKGYYQSKNGPFNFSQVYNPPTEQQVKYSARRVWSIFRRVAPSLHLSPDYSSSVKGAKPYPLWIKPDRKLSVAEVMALHRDHYEGTQFDMTKDLMAGPFGAPDRWRPINWKVDGREYSWERPISTQQVASVFVSQSRADVPDEIGGVYWYGLDNPYTNFFIPLYTSITAIPEAYTKGSMRAFSHDSAWWMFNFVANYANLRYRDMIVDIQKVQKEIEDQEFALQPEIEQTARGLLASKRDLIPVFLTNYCLSTASTNLQRWVDLAELLITKYNDGYVQDEKGRPREMGYPEEWLRQEIKKNPERFRLKEGSGSGKEL
ncbi:MAG TPA: C69 family dipeptidase [Candidatus Saccharicenans sp.]|jgi:dipeptidase|nr:C69 family dipeptidase [Candidatus Saccharicenans sp.]HRD02058.1 C69 family dipeptidase [Candidatus Saccharicenans sp.]